MHIPSPKQSQITIPTILTESHNGSSPPSTESVTRLTRASRLPRLSPRPCQLLSLALSLLRVKLPKGLLLHEKDAHLGRRGSDPSEMTNKDIQQIGNRGARGRLQEITATGEADDTTSVDPFSQAESNDYAHYPH